MKKIIAFCFLLISVVSFAQNDVLKDTVVKPVITGIGKPDGEKVILQIGKEGGSLKSSDGKVELVFPVGALTENTNIIIQPVTNLAPNGAGKAYWFEPSGIQFKKPVQIIFNYTDEEAEICPRDLMGLAIQNKQGQWSFINYDSWDSTTRSLKSSITHFSGYTNVNKMKLMPSGGIIPVRTKLEMEIVDISAFFEKGEADFSSRAQLDENKTVLWYVNDMEGGNFRVGLIRPHFKVFADYQAPSSLPGKNPVTIKAELYLLKKSREGKTLNLIKTLTSKLHISDAYKVTMVHSSQSYAANAGNITYKDTGSFVVSITGKDAEITETVNKNTVADWEIKGGECKVTQKQPGSGSINITKAISVKVITDAKFPDHPWVVVTFAKSLTVLPIMEFDCPVYKSKSRSITTTADPRVSGPMAKMPAFPMLVKFKALNGEQTIEEMGNDGSFLYYKVTVRQITED